MVFTPTKKQQNKNQSDDISFDFVIGNDIQACPFENETIDTQKFNVVSYYGNTTLGEINESRTQMTE